MKWEFGKQVIFFKFNLKGLKHVPAYEDLLTYNTKNSLRNLHERMSYERVI